MGIKAKKVLITAGPTWVPLDSVRVIGNTASGQTGQLLAERFAKTGARVTLFLGPAPCCYIDKKIRVIRFSYYNELRQKLIQLLKKQKFDIIIHSAAVSDFKPDRTVKGKLRSGSNYTLRLKPLPKIIDSIRKLAKEAKLVMFKLEAGLSEKALIKKAVDASLKAKADMVVANKLNPYAAFIIDMSGKKVVPVKNNASLAEKLCRALS